MTEWPDPEIYKKQERLRRSERTQPFSKGTREQRIKAEDKVREIEQGQSQTKKRVEWSKGAGRKERGEEACGEKDTRK